MRSIVQNNRSLLSSVKIMKDPQDILERKMRVTFPLNAMCNQFVIRRTILRQLIISE